MHICTSRKYFVAGLGHGQLGDTGHQTDHSLDKCFAIMRSKGISKSCTDLDRSGQIYNVTPHFEAHIFLFKMA